jgi:ATP-dependent helicase/DNAse subunit B
LEKQIHELIKTISFSSLQDYKFCPYFYNLSHVQKLKPFISNVWTHYGTILHRSVQAVLMNKVEPNVAAKRFDRFWTKFCGLYKKQIVEQVKENVVPVDFKIPAIAVILSIRQSFLSEFGPHEVLSSEEWLRSKCDPYFQSFVGCIDLVVKLQNGKIIIADFKSCDSSFMFNKFMDCWKSYQLTLYAHFYSLKHNIDPKNIETYFVTLERNSKSKKPLQFSRITCGPKKSKYQCR